MEKRRERYTKPHHDFQESPYLSFDYFQFANIIVFGYRTNSCTHLMMFGGTCVSFRNDDEFHNVIGFINDLNLGGGDATNDDELAF